MAAGVSGTPKKRGTDCVSLAGDAVYRLDSPCRTAMSLQMGFPMAENLASYSVMMLPSAMSLWCRSFVEAMMVLLQNLRQ